MNNPLHGNQKRRHDIDTWQIYIDTETQQLKLAPFEEQKIQTWLVNNLAL